MKKYLPDKGDIAVFQPPDKEHEHGHIQMYNGKIWVSDFKQEGKDGFWPGPAYRQQSYMNKKDSFAIYHP